MKKVLVILMTLAMVVSCFAGLTISSSAAELEYVEETYRYAEAAEADYGSHTSQVNAETGAITGEYTLGTYWTYEWLDVEKGEFHPMSAFHATAQPACGWTNFYTATPDANLVKVFNTYCNVANLGKRMHPGDGAGSVITFIAPATGIISYDVSLYSYGSGNASDNANGGDSLWLYVNDKKVWPENEEDGYVYYDINSKSDPKVVSVSSFEVNAGDKVRFVLTTKAGTNNSGKGCDIIDCPVVTYHSAKKADGSVMPVGNPKGEAPINVFAVDATVEGCTVIWDAAKNAKGYNVYIAGKKLNSDLITETSYVITGLEQQTQYEVAVTTVTNSDTESDPCESVPFRTKKDPNGTTTPGTVTDTSTADPSGTTTDPSDTTTDTSTQVTVTSNIDTNKTDDSSSSMLWIIIAAAVVVVVVIVVVVVVISKKKKKA